MVKIFFVTICCLNLFANDCNRCHVDNAPNLKTIYFRYLLKFGSHEKIKIAMIDFAKNPSKDKSQLPPQAINRYGLCEKSSLDDVSLRKNVEEIIEVYKVKFSLKKD